MTELREKVISYLNLGLNPTVVGFQDDGLYYLFDKLLQGKQTASSYDPTFSFVHISLSSLTTISIESIEEQVNLQLERDAYPGDTVIETLDHEVQVVCVFDDIAYIEAPELAVKAGDALIKKYRGMIHVVYIVENPMLINEMKTSLNANSSFFDGIIYQEIGGSWRTKDLAGEFADQFRKKLSDKQIQQISSMSNNHYGLFKRMYKDKVLEIDSSDRYAKLLVESMDPDIIRAFQKQGNKTTLTDLQENVIDAYSRVGFLEGGSITIPVLGEIVHNSHISTNIDIDEESRLIGLDLNVFTQDERRIVEMLMTADEIRSKSEIADAIWKDKSTEKYSDWAIDQRIARLRRKIIDNGFNIDIQTIYGKGYQLVKLNI